VTAYSDVGGVAITAQGLVIGSRPPIGGLEWPVTKAPTFQTRIQRAVSGRELRALDYPYPLWQFQLGFAVLRDPWDGRGTSGFGAGYDEVRALYALYMACYGAYGTFLFDDPTDSQRQGQVIATGDGVTQTFQLAASYGAAGGPSFTAPVTAVNALTAVYFNGVVQSPSGYSCATGLNSTGVLSFTAAPPAGVQLSADFSFYFRCRFVDDSLTFENFLYQLWNLKALKFITVLG
jgi:uncharacterized protein (TIGR02217 family)